MFQFDDGLGQEWAWLEPPFEDLHYHGATRELECPTSSKHGGYPIYGAQPWARSSGVQRWALRAVSDSCGVVVGVGNGRVPRLGHGDRGRPEGRPEKGVVLDPDLSYNAFHPPANERVSLRITPAAGQVLELLFDCADLGLRAWLDGEPVLVDGDKGTELDGPCAPQR